MDKREKEQKVVELMIGVYCKGRHGYKKELCPKCQELLEYARLRTEKCPFMETKSFCSACKVHCYTKDKRVQIKDVMRYAGPRMLYSHPIMAVKHAFVTLKGKLGK